MSTLSDVGAKVGSGFKADRARITTVEKGKVDKVVGKQLSTEDYSTAEKSKLAGIEEGAEVNVVTSVASKVGNVTLNKTDVGLNNVDNTADINKNVRSATKLNTPRSIALSGGVSGTVAFDGSSNVNVVTTVDSVAASAITSGTINADRLPSYVDDVLEYANLAGFPVTGTTGKIYVALDTNKTYRWSGSVYIYITSGAVDSVNGMTGVVNITAISGNSGTATALQNTRTFSATGDVTATAQNFNGTSNLVLPLVLANSGVTAGSYSKVTVDAKGRVTAGLTPTMEDIPDATFKRSVKVATTANIALSAAQTIDGIVTVAGDRVLVKDQTTASQNGIYVVNAAAWTRALDANSSSKIASALVAVDSGTVNGGRLFDNDFKTTDTLDTTSLTWNMNLDDASLLTATSSSIGTVKYNGVTSVVGQFDGGTTTPTGVNRLNYGCYFYPTSLNLVGTADTTTATTHVYVETGSDGFVRPKTLANFRKEIEDTLGANIAAAATTSVGTVGAGDYIHITGTVAITSFGTANAAGIRRTLIFDGALTLTHNATSLICPGASNIVTVAGTVIEVIAETTANWRVVSVTHPSLSMAELSYLDGVTSAIQTQFNAKAPLASPALTGTPTAPTASSGTATTQVATTQYVVNEINKIEEW